MADNKDNRINKVNTDNLKIGMVFSYEDLCKAVGERIVNRYDSWKQTYNWRRYFDYIYVNGKYKITYIYNKPFNMEIEDWLKGYFINNGRYLLMKLLEDEKDNPYILKTRSQLYKELEYTTNLHNEADTYEIDDTLDNAHSVYNNKFYYLNYVLKDLRKHYLISWDKVYVIKKSKDAPFVEEEHIITNINNRYYNENSDRTKIIQAEADVLYDFYNKGMIDTPDLNEIGRLFLFDEFHSEVNAMLKKKYGWIECSKAYRIKPVLNEHLWKRNFETFELEKSRYEQKILSYILDNAEYRYTKKYGYLEVNQVVDMLVNAGVSANKILRNADMSNHEIQLNINSILN